MSTAAPASPSSPAPAVFPRVLALSFLAGAAIMAAEIAAPRLTAPHLGLTVLSWNAILAVFLASIAIGNAIGGRLADRAKRSTLGTMFAVAGLLIAAAVPLDLWLRAGHATWLSQTMRVFLGTTIAFAPGAIAFGCIGPTLGRAALAASPTSGRALGLVGAASALGSVFGTFITGFLLVPHLGTRVIYLGAGAILLLCIPMARTVPPGTRRASAPPARGEDGPVLPRGWAALAALAGAMFLALEVVAARVAANRLGTSIYTWTSVLGVMLIALAVGNAIGGRLADRHEPAPLMRRLLLVASAAMAACLWTPALTSYVTGWDMSWMLRSLLAVAAGFLLPAVAVGTLTPVVIRGALKQPGTDGRTVGKLYAIGTLGAVVGALVPSLWFLPLAGLPALITVLALLLALAPMRAGGRPEIPWVATLVVVMFLATPGLDFTRGLGASIGLREDVAGVHVEDSRYFHIRVEDHDVRWVPMAPHTKMDVRYLATDATLQGQLSFDTARRLILWKGPMSDAQAETLLAGVLDPGNRVAMETLVARAKHRVRLLSLDRFVHGFVDLEDPRWLEYEYEILQAALLRALWPQDEPVSAYFIGGGTYTFQRRLLDLHGDRVTLRTAEIDARVTAVAHERLDLPPLGPRHAVAHKDARTDLRGIKGRGTYDFVFGDAFHDLGVPWHLTTREFAEEVAEQLTDDGIYVVNMIDVFRYGRFLGAFVSTLETVFPHVRVLGMGPRDDDKQQTFLLVASQNPLTWGALVDDRGVALPAIEYSTDDVAAVKARAEGRILTDDHAPVEALLAPVVRLRAAGGARSQR
ncbi:MAG: fused MFS/spermidine synthase [Planctomycetota bacterium]|nr:fused MFS/spermidine synthase [Planctomycetota bacterium]